MDDHPAFLRAVEIVLAATPDFELVGSSVTGEAALEELSTRVDVDLVLLDVHLPGMSGIEVARRYGAGAPSSGKRRRAHVILTSTAAAEDLALVALPTVTAFMPKDALSTSTLRRLLEPTDP